MRRLFGDSTLEARIRSLVSVSVSSVPSSSAVHARGNWETLGQGLSEVRGNCLRSCHWPDDPVAFKRDREGVV